jgi:DNA excision repair protein ERCC-3
MAKRGGAAAGNGSTAEDSDASAAAANSSKRVKKANGSSGKPSKSSNNGKGKQRAVDQDSADGQDDDGDDDEVPDEDDLDLAYTYRSAGESSSGGSDFGADDDAEYSESGGGGGVGTTSSSKKNGKKGRAAKAKSSSGRGIVLSSASKELYTQASDQPGSVARKPPGVTDTSSLVSALFPGQGDAAYLPLKPDHLSRPLYIAPSHPPYIILEAFHPLSLQAQDFLTAIAEPVSRPKHVHEYKLTKHSLYAAVSIGLEPEDIIGVLSRLSKVKIPPETIEYIREATKSFGKVRLVLKDTKYYVESGYPDTLRLLLRDKIISDARATEEGQSADLETATAPKKSSLVIPGTKYAGAGAAGEHVTDGGVASEPAAGAEGAAANGQEEDGLFTAFVGLDADEEAEDDDNVHRFQIKADEMENVKKRCNDLEYPMLQEYDFRADSVNPNLEIALKPATQIRPYQEKSLRKMFSNE